MSSVTGLAEVVLLVRDLDHSLGFYGDALGLALISPPGMTGRAFLRIGAPAEGVPRQIVLVQRPADAPDQPGNRAHRGLHHIGLEITPEDFESEQARFATLGFDVRTGEHPFLQVQAFYIDDPDGNEVEIVAVK